MINQSDISRFDFPKLLNDMGLNGYGAEIGVHQGHHARGLLERWGCKKLYLVDAWRELTYWKDSFNTDREGHANNMMQTYMNTYHFGERVCLVRELSVDAANMFPDGHFDFIYIDANHSYEAFKEDFEAWLPKLKGGGIFSGDDFTEDDETFGVGKYIREQSDLDIHITTEPDGRFSSWYILN